MNIKAFNFKRTGLSIALAAAFLGAAGSSAFAQDWQWRDRNADIRIDGRRQQLEEQKGFKDGLIAGRRDARAHLKYHPAGSIRYQLGGISYRRGFQNGYAQAYRQFDDEYVYRNNSSSDARDVNRNYQYRQGGYYDRSGNFHSN
jgi:hypothetical protein